MSLFDGFKKKFLYWEAFGFIEKGKYLKALEKYEEILKIDPNDPEALTNRCNVFF